MGQETKLGWNGARQIVVEEFILPPLKATSLLSAAMLSQLCSIVFQVRLQLAGYSLKKTLSSPLANGDYVKDLQRGEFEVLSCHKTALTTIDPQKKGEGRPGKD